MEPFTILGECFALAAVLCVLHSTKPKLGLAPLYGAVGLFEAFLFVAGKAEPAIKASLFGVDPANVSYTLFLPLMLASIFLIYVLEGTKEARRLIAAVAIIYLIHGVIDVIIEYHASNPPAGEPFQGEIDLVWYSTTARVASLVAMVVDFVVIIVVYQFLYNRFKQLPLFVPFFAALVVAMLTDSVVFSLIRYQELAWGRLMAIEKLQSGAAAAIPVSAYLAWQLRRHENEVRSGVLERGAFEIIDLRARVKEFEAKLKEQRAQYIYIKETFSRYVSPAVVDAIIKDPARVRLGGELRTVTILFADIRGYSTISEVLEPTEIIDLLNDFFASASGVILARNGMINEFEGDAVLAIFGAPLDLPGHAELAVLSALELLDEVDKLNDTWVADGTSKRFREAGMDRLSIRIGVHTGPVVAGNVGSEERIKYAVIGDTVNTTSRIETLSGTLGSALLVSSTTVEAVREAGLELPWQDHGEHHVKGRTEPVRVYSLGADSAAALRKHCETTP